MRYIYKSVSLRNRRRTERGLINLLDGWATSTAWCRGCAAAHVRHAAWHTTWHAALSWWGTASCCVHLGDDRRADTLELLLLVLELVLLGGLVGIEPRHGRVNLVDNRLLVLLREFVLDLLVLDSLLHRVGVRLEGVLGRDLLAGLLVLDLEALGLVDHALNVLLGEPTLVVGDGDLLGLAGRLVGRRHVEDTVGIDIKGDFDLRHATRCRGDPGQLELSEHVVVLGHGTLAFVDLDEDTWLVVGVRGEGLGLLGRDGRVTLDERSHDTASSLEAHRQRGDVEEQEILDLLGRVTLEDRGLHGGTVGHSLVRVDRLVELLAVEEVLEELLDLRDPGGATDEDNLVDRGLVELGVTERLLDWVEGTPEEVGAELLEASPGDRRVHVDALEERVDLDRSLGGRRQRPLCPLARGAESTERALVAREVLVLVLALKLLDEVVHEPVVKVFATEVGVAGGRLDLEHPVVDREDRHVKGPAAEVKDQHVALADPALLVEPVRERRGGRLVDDAEHVEAGDDCGILGRGTLGVVEVGRDGDDCIGDGLAEVGLCRLLHLGEDHRGDLLRGELLLLAHVLDLDLRLVASIVDHGERPVLGVRGHRGVVEVAADQPLGIEDRVGRVEGHLVLGGVADQSFGVREGHVRRGGPIALIVGDDLHLSIVENSDARIRCAQVDPDCLVLGSRHCGVGVCW
eukprot:m.292930 g.292930  ORF g.292930 m.292930 type:complete len:688 (+) comp27130_c3_seq9:38-2101(+)